MKHTSPKALAAASAAVMALAAPAALAEPLFWSTQAQPIEETQAMREQVLAGFPGGVSFQASDAGPWITRLQAELSSGSGSIAVLGALHGDLSPMGPDLVDLSAAEIGDIPEGLLELGRLGTGEQKYVPWMQATFLMAANRQALDYLPEGADLNALTYDELIAWARNMAEQTGQPRFGFPAGPQGLKHRFFQGYMLPSFTGSMVSEFRSDEAVAAWEAFRELWSYANPASVSFNFMQEPLVSDDVWVAFDHTARLADAFNQRPDDFVAFPAPAGPAGRAFMPVIAGMAVPRTAPDMDASMDLVNFMLQPETQIATLRATNFFPVVEVDLPEDMPASVRAFGPAIAAMTGAPDAMPALLPVGLGTLGGQFNAIYADAFERIILGRQDIATVLDDQAAALRAIMEEADAPCWAPDAPSEGACPVN